MILYFVVCCYIILTLFLSCVNVRVCLCVLGGGEEVGVIMQLIFLNALYNIVNQKFQIFFVLISDFNFVER